MRADGAGDPFGCFRYLGGRLTVEALPLDELAHDLAGQAAWVLSRSAIASAFAGVRRCLPVGVVGPAEVLAEAAAAGWWTAVVSSHELELAERAGFPPERTSAPAGWRDDGFVKDALTRGIAALAAEDETDEQNIERIARLLGVDRPGPADVPPTVALDALAGSGGLLAPVLRGGQALVLDAAPVGLLAGRDPGATLDVLPLGAPDSTAPDASAALEGTLTGLSSPATRARGLPARLHGAAVRGDWVLIPSLGATAARPPDLAHRQPLHVLVQGGQWRPLEQRSLPPVGD